MNKSSAPSFSSFAIENENEQEHMSQNSWEERYQAGDTHWDHGAPSPGLVDFLAAHPELPHGTVCIPGCGAGHDVREFARAGFEAHGFDIAPSAIRLAMEKTKEVGQGALASCRRDTNGKKHAGKVPAFPGTAQFHLADFLHDAPPQLFDWIFEHTLFCAIQPPERDDYVRAVRHWLKPGGQYLAVNYMIVEDKEGPPFPTTRDELLRRFSPHLELVADWVPRSYPNRAGRERMFWWRGQTAERNAFEKRQKGG